MRVIFTLDDDNNTVVTFNDGNYIIITVIEEGSIKKIIVDIEDNEIGELY